jgi:hypothetical protein
MNPSSDMEWAVVTNPIDFPSCSLSVPFATDEEPQLARMVAGQVGSQHRRHR